MQSLPAECRSHQLRSRAGQPFQRSDTADVLASRRTLVRREGSAQEAVIHQPSRPTGDFRSSQTRAGVSISVIPGRWQRKRRVGTVVSSDPYRDHYTFGMPDREKPVFPRRRRLVVHLSSSEALAPSGAVRPGRRHAGPQRGPRNFACKPRNN